MASRAAIPRVHRNGISGTLSWGRLLTAASSQWLADRTATRVILTAVRHFRWRVRTPLLSTLWPELSNGVLPGADGGPVRWSVPRSPAMPVLSGFRRDAVQP